MAYMLALVQTHLHEPTLTRIKCSTLSPFKQEIGGEKAHNAPERQLALTYKVKMQCVHLCVHARSFLWTCLFA